MPKKYVSLAFSTQGSTDNRYISDHVDPYILASTGFYIPVHLEATWSASKTTAIASAVGAFAMSWVNNTGEKQVINDFGKNPCPLSSTLTPRKILFYFTNGTSASIPIGKTGTNIRTAYNALKTELETNDVKVICAHLQGEEWANLNDVSGVAFNPSEATAPAGNGSYYSGILTEYKSEITNSVVPLSFKILTSAGTPPGSELPPIFDQHDDCLGGVSNQGFTCPVGRNAITTRRIIVNYKSDANTFVSEQREIPVKETGQGLKTCLTGIGAEPGVYCISYRGETRKNIHSLPTQTP